MQEQMSKIATLAEEAMHLLVTSGISRRSFGGANEAQKRATMEFLRSAKRQASEGQLLPSLEEEAVSMAQSYESLPPNEREPAFRCVASYKACKIDAKSLEDKILCGIALAICFAKEVVPLA